MPPQSSGPRGKMIVMYGSELMQVEFPGNGGLPTNPFKKDSFAPTIGPGTALTGGAGNAGSEPRDTTDSEGQASPDQQDNQDEFTEDKSE